MAATAWAAWVAIAFGSAVGGVLRHMVSEGVTSMAGGNLPYGTLTVNLLGSLAIGGCVALSTTFAPTWWTPMVRHATMTGLLGGFTTFSTFSMQTMALLQQGMWAAAVANALASVILGVGACAIGYAAVAMLLP